jgi:hypothetical protein
MLLFGQKRWILSAPSEATSLGLGRIGLATTTTSRSEHVQNWLATEYPAHHKAGRFAECVQGPGDRLFIPLGWGHATENLAPTLAVAQEFCVCAGSCCGGTCSLGPMFAGDSDQVMSTRISQQAARRAARQAMNFGADLGS